MARPGEEMDDMEAAEIAAEVSNKMDKVYGGRSKGLISATIKALAESLQQRGYISQEAAWGMEAGARKTLRHRGSGWED